MWFVFFLLNLYYISAYSMKMKTVKVCCSLWPSQLTLPRRSETILTNTLLHTVSSLVICLLNFLSTYKNIFSLALTSVFWRHKIMCRNCKTDLSGSREGHAGQDFTVSSSWVLVQDRVCWVKWFTVVMFLVVTCHMHQQVSVAQV